MIGEPSTGLRVVVRTKSEVEFETSLRRLAENFTLATLAIAGVVIGVAAAATMT